jgi:hypothetical protein
VKNGLVGLVRERPEDLHLGAGGVREQSQRLVGVDGDHYLVEGLAPGRARDLDAVVEPAD